jgi:hypothetical protein
MDTRSNRHKLQSAGRETKQRLSFNRPKTKIKIHLKDQNRVIYDPMDFFGYKCQSKHS